MKKELIVSHVLLKILNTGHFLKKIVALIPEVEIVEKYN